MGGKGSGGRRPGTGRKPKTAEKHAIQGTTSQASAPRVLPHPSSVPLSEAPPAAAETFAPPKGLTREERGVWKDLAPHAFANGTLTRASALSFQILTRNVVLERHYAKSLTDRGTANHRGLIQRVDAELLRFNLAPCGKPMAGGSTATPTEQPAANPVLRFLKGRR